MHEPYERPQKPLWLRPSSKIERRDDDRDLRQFGGQAGPHIAKTSLRVNNVRLNAAECLIKVIDCLDHALWISKRRNTRPKLMYDATGGQYLGADGRGGWHPGDDFELKALTIKLLGKP